MYAHELAMSLRAAYLAMHRRTGAVLARSGVTADQFVVLAALSESDALTQRELVSRTCSDPNTVRAMLVLLERRRLVDRRPHPTDGRARSVSLTRNGRNILRKLWRQTETLRERLVAPLSLDEAAALIDGLRRITIALQSERTNLSNAEHRTCARAAT